MKRYQLDATDSLLVVVDVQERLAAVMTERERVVANVRRLIGGARILGVPTLHTEQYPKGLGGTVPELAGELGDAPPVEKLTFDCCGEPAFLEAIEATGRRTAVVCGMEAHVCVLQTVLGLLELGLTVHVAADAVCSRDERNARTALDLVRDAGAAVTVTETVLYQWLVRAGTPEFRAVLKLVK